MNHSTARYSSIIKAAGALLLASVVTMLGGCASAPKEQKAAPTPVLFPAPPAVARVQYLGSISGEQDLPKQRGGFAEFVLGEEAPGLPLAKPIAATMVGSRLYVCDTVFNSIIMYDLASGESRALIGDRGIGKIQQPNNVTLDDEGRLYVADKVRKAVLVFGPDESFQAAWGRPNECAPVDMAILGDELFVCDPDEHEIEVWSRKDGSFLRKFGGLGKEPGQFYIPTQIATSADGNLYVTDTGNFRVQKVSPNGEPITVVGGPGRTFGKFAWPKGLDVDGKGRLYVADSRFANVQIFDPEGRLLLFFGGPGPDAGNIDLPAGVTVLPWPDSVAWLSRRVAPGFTPEFLVIVVNQQGAAFVNFFAVARDPEAVP